MDFVENLVDYGGVPEFHATGVGAASRLSHGTVRVTLYDARELPDGSVERRVAAYVLCDFEAIEDAPSMLAVLSSAIRAAIPLSGRLRKRSLDAH